MKIVCAWCGKHIGERDSQDVEEVSHGVCEECLDKMEAQARNGLVQRMSRVNNEPE